jgi:hypothetical protein
MKIVSFILAIATATLVAVCVIQSQKLGEQKTQLANAKEEIEQNSAELEKLEAAQKHSRAQRDALLHQADILTAELQTARATQPPPSVEASATNTAAGQPVADARAAKDDGAGFGKMLSKMMQDPEMKKFIKAQQKVMVDQLYGPLAKKLAMTPEDTDKFKELIADNMANSAEKATSMFGGGDATNRTAAIEAITANQKSFDEQMKSFLGDDRYSEYKSYQETVGERTQLNQFQQQNASGGNALNDQQVDQLLTLMKEEKQSAISRGDSIFGDTKDPAKVQEMLAGGQLDKMLQGQEEINERVYDRARDVLTPSQLNSFGAFQTNQLTMMRMGMSMAKQMFGSGKQGQ